MCVYVCVYAMCARVRMWVYNTVYMCTVCVYVYIYIHVYAYIYAFTTCMCIIMYVYAKKSVEFVMSIYYIRVLIYLLTCIQYTTMKNIEVFFKYVMCNVAPWAFTLLLWWGQSKVAPVKRFCPKIPWLIIIDPFKLQVSLVYAPWTNGQTHVDTYKCKCTYIFIYKYIVLYICINVHILLYIHMHTSFINAYAYELLSFSEAKH